MTQQQDPAAPPALPALKLDEPEVDSGNPWGDDVLDRKEIADRLTSIVRGQEAPFVISLDGRWGTGKTFLLKRWVQDLQNQDTPWEAIYYNAWEDDFAGDPLLSITGQFSEHFRKTTLADRARRLGDLIQPLLRFGASAAAVATTGVPLPDVPSGQQVISSSLADYLEKRAAKDKLTESLGELATEVNRETREPLVFVIDELDRCRPTFAIQLLERVKHIFDVPNIVFVFGINRGELVKSLESVYGEIDTGAYLRRFFDMEFVLPDPDPQPFCASLVRKFRLEDFFEDLGKTPPSNSHVSELRDVSSYLPVLVATMGLSLRDIDYCIRLLALATRTLEPGQSVHPPLFVVLAAIKIENTQLYHRFIAGRARGAEIVDYLNGRAAEPYSGSSYSEWDVRRILSNIEGAIYCADNPGIVLDQLKHLAQRTDLDHPQYLSSEIARLDASADEDRQRIQRMIELVLMYRERTNFASIGRSYLAAKIDLYAGFMRPS